MPTYRVRYRNGELEVEVESSDKAYVETKLKELLADPAPQAASRAPGKSRPKATPRSAAKGTAADSDSGSDDALDIPKLVEQINEFDRHADLDARVLNSRAALPRVLMCLYFVREQANPFLSSTQIEAVTNQLGVRIFSNNVARTVKDNQRFFTTDKVRRRGAQVKYKLNRQGIQAFENLLAGRQT